jgi:hypothetical protein
MVDVYFQFTVFKRSFELEATSVNFHVEQITDRPTDDSHHSSLDRSTTGATRYQIKNPQRRATETY